MDVALFSFIYFCPPAGTNPMPYWAHYPYGQCDSSSEYTLMSVDPSDKTAIPAIIAQGTQLVFSVGGWNFPRFVANILYTHTIHYMNQILYKDELIFTALSLRPVTHAVPDLLYIHYTWKDDLFHRSITTPCHACSEYFSKMVSSAENRAKFVKSVQSWMTKYNAVGVDIDWEFPCSPARENSVSCAHILIHVDE